MKKFVYNVCLFSFPVILILGTLEFMLRTSNNLYRAKISGFEANIEDIEILVLGNSHADNAINPRSFDMFTYNLALGSQSLYYDREITLKYLSQMKSLKYVLIGLDYHSFYFTHQPSRDFYYSYYYNIDYFGKSDYSSISILFDGYGLEKGLQQIKQEPYNLFHGWSDQFVETDYESLTKAASKKRVENYFHKIIDENPLVPMVVSSELEKFVHELKMNDIEPILISHPSHPNFNAYLRPEILDSNLRMINRIVTNCDATYWNFIYEPLPDSMFYNSDHLNASGAKYLSDKISQKISQF